MKYLLLFAMLWILGGCTNAPELPPASAFPVPIELAWSGEPDGAKWTAFLEEAMKDLPEAGLIQTPCKKLTIKPCAMQLLSVMAKRESSFKPEAKYNETGHLAGAVSRGLLQISVDSANQKAYGCNIKKAQDLHDPKINITCAVKILAYQAKKTGTLIDGEKNGCGSYWSVCRKTSKSYKYIMEYMGKF